MPTSHRNELLMPYEILLDGTAHRARRKTNYRVTIDHNPIELPFRLFKVFVILALRRDVDDGWVEHRLLAWGPADLVWKYASRTRTFLQAAEWRKPGGVDGAWHVMETNPEKPLLYRLVARPETIRMNPELVRFDDRVVAAEAQAFLERQTDRLMCPSEVTETMRSSRRGRKRNSPILKPKEIQS